MLTAARSVTLPTRRSTSSCGSSTAGLSHPHQLPALRRRRLIPFARPTSPRVHYRRIHSAPYLNRDRPRNPRFRSLITTTIRTTTITITRSPQIRSAQSPCRPTYNSSSCKPWARMPSRSRRKPPPLPRSPVKILLGLNSHQPYRGHWQDLLPPPSRPTPRGRSGKKALDQMESVGRLRGTTPTLPFLCIRNSSPSFRARFLIRPAFRSLPSQHPRPRHILHSP